MSLREDLKSIGLSDEQASSAENVLRQFISGDYIPKHRFDELNEKNKSLAQDLGRAQSELEAAEKRAKKAEDGLEPLKSQLVKVETDWKQKYDTLVSTHEQAEKDRVALELHNARIGAINSFLGDSVHDVSMVTSLIDLETLEVKDGKVSGVEKAIEQVRKEKPFLFKDEGWESTAPPSTAKKDAGATLNFGEQLAKKAQATDALTQAAADKYFK